MKLFSILLCVSTASAFLCPMPARSSSNSIAISRQAKIASPLVMASRIREDEDQESSDRNSGGTGNAGDPAVDYMSNLQQNTREVRGDEELGEADKSGNPADDYTDSLQQGTRDAGDKVKETAEDAKEGAKGVGQKAKETIKEGFENVKETLTGDDSNN